MTHHPEAVSVSLRDALAAALDGGWLNDGATGAELADAILADPGVQSALRAADSAPTTAGLREALEEAIWDLERCVAWLREEGRPNSPAGGGHPGRGVMHIRFRYEKAGGHVHVRVFAGRDTDHLALAGRLAFREDERDQEWTAFRDRIAGGPTASTYDFIRDRVPPLAEDLGG